MVGLFSRFSVSRSSGNHRRTQSSLDERGPLPQIADVADTTAVTAASATAHGIEIAIEFKPVERPIEPLDNDQPVKCPLPEPSILNDGRLWKERISATTQRRNNLPIRNLDSEAEVVGRGRKRNGSSQSNRSILPSISAPEHNLVTLLDECNASGI